MARIEEDTLGTIKVASNKYWGAQTQRSLKYFAIGTETFPLIFIKAYAIVKRAAATVNAQLNLLPHEKAELIVKVCQEIIDDKLNENFPLSIWQTGSGTQTNMNLNEVIANRANELAGSKLGSKTPIHPNDDVNLSQSTNDTFSTAMHVAAATTLHNLLLPVLQDLHTELHKKEVAFKDIIKIGRTHLQDAVPLTVGQEFSAFAAQIKQNICHLNAALQHLYKLACGATAVGTGVNSHKDFAVNIAHKIAELVGLPFSSADNKFASIAAHDEIVFTSSALKTLANSLFKIANDIRWLGSGPRCGLGELLLPTNEPGSSIMPGKINPTQCEAMLMVCTQVIGNDATISFAGSQGNLQLNNFKPVMIFNLLQSITLLSDACKSFSKYLVKGLQVKQKQLDIYLQNSLMLVTALTPKIGYDKAAEVAKYAYNNQLSLHQAVVKLGFLTKQQFDKLVKPKDLLQPNL